jgi:hypothetical protein
MTAANRSSPGDRLREWRVHERQRQLRRILMAWDPIGVADIAQAADEYDCMMGQLLRMLEQKAGPSRIEEWLIHELRTHFGLTPDKRREARLAEDWVAWWATRFQDDDRPSSDVSRGVVGMRDLRAALVRLTVGQQPSEELPDLAARALADGAVDSPLLRELGGLSATDVRESWDLFLAATAELGVEAPTDGSHEQLARFWAGRCWPGLSHPMRPAVTSGGVPGSRSAVLPHLPHSSGWQACGRTIPTTERHTSRTCSAKPNSSSSVARPHAQPLPDNVDQLNGIDALSCLKTVRRAFIPLT